MLEVAAQGFLAVRLAVEGVVLLPLSGEWPLLKPLCRQHQLVGNAISDGWIAAAVLARRQVLATFDRDLLPLASLSPDRGCWRVEASVCIAPNWSKAKWFRIVIALIP